MTLGEIVLFLEGEGRLYIPPQELKVVIVDDEEWAVEGMELVLDAWRNIRRKTIIHKWTDMPDNIPMDTDILLLDRDFARGTVPLGELIARRLRENNFHGLIAATTIRRPGTFESYAEWHYPNKFSLDPKHPDLNPVRGFRNFLTPILKRRVEQLEKQFA